MISNKSTVVGMLDLHTDVLASTLALIHWMDSL